MHACFLQSGAKCPGEADVRSHRPTSQHRTISSPVIGMLHGCTAVYTAQPISIYPTTSNPYPACVLGMMPAHTSPGGKRAETWDNAIRACIVARCTFLVQRPYAEVGHRSCPSRRLMVALLPQPVGPMTRMVVEMGNSAQKGSVRAQTHRTCLAACSCMLTQQARPKAS